jgi:hypothetical protein
MLIETPKIEVNAPSHHRRPPAIAWSFGLAQIWGGAGAVHRGSCTVMIVNPADERPMRFCRERETPATGGPPG